MRSKYNLRVTLSPLIDSLVGFCIVHQNSIFNAIIRYGHVCDKDATFLSGCFGDPTCTDTVRFNSKYDTSFDDVIFNLFTSQLTSMVLNYKCLIDVTSKFHNGISFLVIIIVILLHSTLASKIILFKV